MKRLFWLMITALTVVIDQLTKFLAVKFLKPVDTVPLIEGVLHLTYLENRGAAFGMLKDHRWVFMVTSTVAVIAVLAFMMAVTTLSLPSLIMLRKAVRPPLLALFVAVCVAGITVVGYLFNGIGAFLL